MRKGQKLHLRPRKTGGAVIKEHACPPPKGPGSAPEKGSPSPNQPEDFEPCKGEKLSEKETVALSPA